LNDLLSAVMVIVNSVCRWAFVAIEYPILMLIRKIGG